MLAWRHEGKPQILFRLAQKLWSNAKLEKRAPDYNGGVGGLKNKLHVRQNIVCSMLPFLAYIWVFLYKLDFRNLLSVINGSFNCLPEIKVYAVFPLVVNPSIKVARLSLISIFLSISCYKLKHKRGFLSCTDLLLLDHFLIMSCWKSKHKRFFFTFDSFHWSSFCWSFHLCRWLPGEAGFWQVNWSGAWNENLATSRQQQGRQCTGVLWLRNHF